MRDKGAIKQCNSNSTALFKAGGVVEVEVQNPRLRNPLISITSHHLTNALTNQR